MNFEVSFFSGAKEEKKREEAEKPKKEKAKKRKKKSAVGLARRVGHRMHLGENLDKVCTSALRF